VGVGRIGRNGVAVGRMIVAYSRGDGAATNYEIAWVAVALQHLRAGDDSWTRIDPVHRWLQILRFGGRSSGTWRRPRPARLGELSSASGHGATRNPLSEHGGPPSRPSREGRRHEACAWRALPDRGLAGVPGRVTSLAG
jgi:hypothetical protein